MLLHLLNSLAIVATAVVFGTDVFFAVVGKKAIAKSSDQSIADLIAHIHEVADARMPVFGILAIISTLLQVVLQGLNTLNGQISAVSLTTLLIHLAIYFKVSKPVNHIMIEGVKFGRMIDDIRDLQHCWERVIYFRAILLLITIVGLITAGHL